MDCVAPDDGILHAEHYHSKLTFVYFQKHENLKFLEFPSFPIALY
jgi:hypothetical protein